MLDKYKKEILCLLIIIFITLFVYWPILFSFFQQDEWLSFAHHSMLKSFGMQALFADAFIPSLGHYQPLNTVTIHILYSVFSLNYFWYALISIFLHVVCVVLMFVLTKKLFQSLIAAFFSTLFFAVAASGFQATSWVLADIGIHFASIFAITSVIFFYEFLKNSYIKDLNFSLGFLLISLLFKEIAIGLFLVFPLMIVLFSTQAKKLKKYSIKFIAVVAISYILVRCLGFVIPQSRSDILVTSSQSNFNIVFNIATFPLHGISQSLVPTPVLLDISKKVGEFIPSSIVGIKNTTEFDLFVEKKIFGGLSLAIAFGLLISSFYLWKKRSRLNKLIIFSCALILFSMPIYALSPEKSGKIFIIDSRNLYFVLVGASILLVALFESIFNRIVAKVLLSLIIILNILILQIQLKPSIEVGMHRKQILEDIKTSYPELSEKMIFYTESDSSFYGLPESEKILPFQSGFGQNLIVWYYPTEDFPVEFLQNKYLWEITSQGYKQSGNRGFGYFRDFDLLISTVKNNKLTEENIVAFYYDSKKGKLIDQTEAVRNKVNSIIKND